MERCAAGDEESRDENEEGEAGDPERQHVEDRKGHVRSADLDGQEVVTEAPLGRSRKNEKNHDGAVHGEKGKVGFGFDLSEEREIRGGPDEVNAHEERKKHAGENRRESEEEVLNSDDLV